jgi:hypothetical protein
VSDEYHYPFSNPANGGYASVAANCGVVLVIILVVSGAVVWAGHLRLIAAACTPTSA